MVRSFSLSLVLATVLMALAGATPAAAITPLGQFGEGPGDQAGLLGVPQGVAVDSSGRVYASERTRISVFAPQGAFLRAFGKNVVPGNAGTLFEQCTTICQAGEAGGDSGELRDAVGLAVDAEDRLYVAEFTNHRVSVFSRQGAFLRNFGKDVKPAAPGTGPEVCTDVDPCKQGEAGAGSAEFNLPSGLAIDAAGVLLVAEVGNNRVSMYEPDGTFLRAFGMGVNPGPGGRSDVCSSHCGAGIRSGVAGALGAPSAVAVDRAGNIYVSELVNNRVSVFSPQLVFLRAFGADVVPGNDVRGFEVCTPVSGCKVGAGGAVFGRRSSGFRANGPGVLNRPIGVAVDAQDNVFVAEDRNNRISVFRRGTSFLRAFGRDVVPDNARTGFEECRARCKPGVSGGQPGDLATPSFVALDCRGALYVAEIFNGRVQRFGEPGTEPPPCAQPPAFANRFGIMRVERHPRRGTAALIVTVPWSAGVRVHGPAIRPRSKQVEFAGRTRLAIRPTRAAMRRLKRTGRLLVRARVTYSPWGGEPRTKTRKIVLRR
jgi:sugar lactone lactonase YvrE